MGSCMTTVGHMTGELATSVVAHRREISVRQLVKKAQSHEVKPHSCRTADLACR